MRTGPFLRRLTAKDFAAEDCVSGGAMAVEAKRRTRRAELEALLEEEERTTRGLADLALEWMYDGDRVEVHVGRHRWVGTVVHVGADLMTVRAGACEADVKLEALSCVRRVREGGRGRPLRSHFPGSIRARLHQLWSDDQAAELGGARLPGSIRGVVRLVGRHHVEVESDADDWAVPLDAIEWICREL